MSTYGTDVCTVCGGTVRANELASGPCWHHRDLSICQEAIRADERSRLYGGQGWVAEKDVLALLTGLRDKVKALPTRGVGARVIDGELVTYALVERAEVLALFGGESDE